MQENISVLGIKAEEVGLSSKELVSRRGLFAKLWPVSKDRESLLKQNLGKSGLRREMQIQVFFHACIAARRTKNQVLALQVDGNCVEKPEQNKEEVIRFCCGSF